MSTAETGQDPSRLAAISFDDELRAVELMTAMTRLAREQKLRIVDAVFVVKDESGRTHVRETTDLQTGSTALGAGLWSGLFGLILGGPVGMLVAGGIGAGAGALTAKLVDVGVTDEFVAAAARTGPPGDDHAVPARRPHRQRRRAGRADPLPRRPLRRREPADGGHPPGPRGARRRRAPHRPRPPAADPRPRRRPRLNRPSGGPRPPARHPGTRPQSGRSPAALTSPRGVQASLSEAAPPLGESARGLGEFGRRFATRGLPDARPGADPDRGSPPPSSEPPRGLPKGSPRGGGRGAASPWGGCCPRPHQGGQPEFRRPVAMALRLSWMPRSTSSWRSPARWRRSNSTCITCSGSRYG